MKLPKPEGSIMYWSDEGGTPKVAVRLDGLYWSVTGEPEIVANDDVSFLVGSSPVRVVAKLDQKPTSPTHWRGQEVGDLSGIRARISEAMTGEMVCRNARERQEGIFLGRLRELSGVLVTHYTQIWDCPSGPLGYCAYTSDRSTHPLCVFCGEPEERK